MWCQTRTFCQHDLGTGGQTNMRTGGQEDSWTSGKTNMRTGIHKDRWTDRQSYPQGSPACWGVGASSARQALAPPLSVWMLHLGASDAGTSCTESDWWWEILAGWPLSLNAPQRENKRTVTWRALTGHPITWRQTTRRSHRNWSQVLIFHCAVPPLNSLFSFSIRESGTIPGTIPIPGQDS